MSSGSEHDLDLSDLSVDDEKEDELADLELMGEIAAYIQTLKTKPAVNIEKHDGEATLLRLNELPLTRLNALLTQITEAMEHNSFLKHMLLMKEVKLMSVKRQLQASRSGPDSEEQAALLFRGDIGRYIVKFKAPYFKTARDFASYVIVPENRLPMSAQRFDRNLLLEWNKLDLQHLEQGVKNFMSLHSLRYMMQVKPANPVEKKKILDKFNYLRKSATQAQLMTPDADNIIDWCRIASKMTKNFTPSECEKAWSIFLRPGLNRKRWSACEKEKLRQLALEHNYEDWDAVAEELGGGRSGYQCFLVYAQAIMKQSEGEWSNTEEESLIDMVKSCTYGERILWRKISYYFESRSLAQIYRKWNLSSVGKDIRAGPFTEEEDQVIINSLILNVGNLPMVAKRLNRISSQIHYRFSQLKNSMVHNHGEWTVAEDKQLLELVERFGSKKWATIAKHLTSRGRVQIRHRYTHLASRLAANPSLNIDTITRARRPVYKERKRTNMEYLLKQAKSKAQLSEKLGQLVPCLDDGASELPKAKKKTLKLKREAGSDMCSNILNFYSNKAKYAGYVSRPADGNHRAGLELELLNGLLRFAPDKHADPRTADWSLTADASDPHFDEVFKLSAARSEPMDDQLADIRRSLSKVDHCLPPNVSTFEAFTNLLIDVGITNGELEARDVKESLIELYSQDDEEMQVAVAKWKRRLRRLFVWPVALADIDLLESVSEHHTQSQSDT